MTSLGYKYHPRSCGRVKNFHRYSPVASPIQGERWGVCHTRCVAENKPRIFQDSKDMMISLLVMIIGMFIVVSTTGLCSFNPGKPENGPVQEVDAATILSMDARSLSYPIRYPDMPADWTTNSQRRTTIAGAPAPITGWVSAGGAFVELLQSDQPEEDVVADFDGQQREATREVDVQGHTFTVYTDSTSDKVRPLWVTTLGPVTEVISGLGTDEDFKVLAQALLQAQPIAAAQS